MAKFKKVKRYKKIYRGSSSRRPTPVGVVATVLGVVALAVLGWSLYDPVYSFLMGNLQVPPAASNSPEDPVGTPEESLPMQEEPAAAAQEVHGVFMPTAVLQNATQRKAFLDALTGTEINAVLFDLKEITGGVTYRSSLESVAKAKSQLPGAVDLGAVVSDLNARGLRSIGRIHAFKDAVGPFGLPESQVHYVGTEWTWLDNSKELGGKPWFNPFSPVAQGYILDLVGEAAERGVQELVIDSLHFPTGFSLDKAAYGQTAGQTERTAVLRDFMKTVQQRAKEHGASARAYLPIPAVLGSETEKYGADPNSIPSGQVALGAMPSLFGNAFSSNDLVMENPVTDPYDTVRRALATATHKLGGASERLVFIQAYTATNVDPLHNKVYTLEDIQSQLKALNELGEKNYILYNPQGTYALEKSAQ